MDALPRPTTAQLKAELARERRKYEYGKTLRGTFYILLTVAAIAVLVATLLLPVLQVTGASMEPTLKAGQIVLTAKNADFVPGDIIAFYYNNKILLKRVIGLPGDKVVIDAEGVVFINGQQLAEPYLTDKALGECDLSFPYQVPDGKYFLLGDHRSSAVDSRSSAMGSIAQEFIVGKVMLRVWPLDQFGPIE